MPHYLLVPFCRVLAKFLVWSTLQFIVCSWRWGVYSLIACRYLIACIPKICWDFLWHTSSSDLTLLSFQIFQHGKLRRSTGCSSSPGFGDFLVCYWSSLCSPAASVDLLSYAFVNVVSCNLTWNQIHLRSCKIQWALASSLAEIFPTHSKHVLLRSPYVFWTGCFQIYI